MRKLITIISLILITGLKVFAAPAYPHPIEYVLPDGTTITITLKGDENINWAISEDGYTLLRNADGFYEYAQHAENNDLVLSGIEAKNIDQRSMEDVFFLDRIEKDLRYSREQIHYLLQIKDMRNSFSKHIEDKQKSGSRDFTGNKTFPVILVGFQGKPFTKTKSQFEALLNQPNYTGDGMTGSLHDYFNAASYNNLNFTCDVFGPYTLSNPISSYDDECDGDPRNMAREAMQLAHADGCNFALYDFDNDGYVDGTHIFYAGYGQEAGAPVCQSIWAHAWSFNPPLNLNGKYVYRYSCSPELRSTYGSNITNIGVIGHELSHVFGLPDTYDTDYSGSGGQSIDLDEWCMMAGGSWNDNGRTPAFHSAWCRNDLGWISATTISSQGSFTLPNPQNSGAAYIINTTTNNEYFMLENRQKVGWDAYIPGSGMLIYHVDENYAGWNNNCINCNPSHRGYYVKQAGCGSASNCTNRTNDPYPYGSNNSFTDISTPNSKSWAGANTAKPVTNITHNTSSRTITFDFMMGGDICDPITSFPHNEGFENSGLSFPLCWMQENVVGNADWAIVSGSAHSGNYYAELSFGSWTSQKTKLIMPEINLAILSNPTLKFWHKQEVWGSDQDILRVFYKTSESGTWTLLQEYTNSITAWTERTITLPSPSSTYYIAFEGETNWGYGVQLDDISISGTGTISCDKQVTNLNVTINNSTQLATLTWTAPPEDQNAIITVSANPAAGGNPSGGGTYQIGATATVSANVNSGYNFVNWTENGSQVSTNANYSFTVSGNRNLVANFQAQGSNNAQVRFQKTDAYIYVPALAVFDDNDNELAGYTFNNDAGTSPYYEIPTGYHYPAYYYSESGYEGWYYCLDSPYTFNFQAGYKYTVVCSDDGTYLVFSVTNDGTISKSSIYKEKIPEIGNTTANYLKVNNILLTNKVEKENLLSSMHITDKSQTRADTYKYNIKLDGVLIASGVETTTYNYNTPVNINESHNWCVTVICPEGAEGTPVCFTTEPSGSSYTISVSANPASGGTVSGGGSYQSGTSATVNATANSDFSFVNWTENGSQVSTTTSYTFTVNDNRTLVANFQSQSGDCNPPTGLTVNYTSDCSAQLSWNAPAKVVANVVYEEGFESTSGTTLPTGWTVSHNGSNDSWITVNSNANAIPGVTGTIPAYEGQRMMVLSWQQSGRNAWAFSSGFSLNEGTEYNISFALEMPGYFQDGANETSSIQCRIGQTATAAGMSSAHLIYQALNTSIPDWTIVSTNFTPTTSGTYYLGFNDLTQQTQWGIYHAIDDIKISNESGGATLYNIYRDNNLIASNVTATTYTDSGFTTSQGHTWSVRTVCSGGGESAPATVTKDACSGTTSYTISVSANPASGGTVSGGGSYQSGTSVTVSATANSGYIFDHWTENNSQVSTNASYTFTVNSNRTLVANFTQTGGGETGEYMAVNPTAKEQGKNVLITWGNPNYNTGTNTSDVDNNLSIPKSITGYTVYRLEEGITNESSWELLSDKVLAHSYIDDEWSSLDPDYYQYAVKVNFKDGTKSKAALTEAIEKSGSKSKELSGINEEEISLYPNPFNNEIFVSSYYAVANIQILNAIGQKIKEIIPTDEVIFTGELPLGVYFVVVETISGKKTTHKMIKK